MLFLLYTPIQVHCIRLSPSATEAVNTKSSLLYSWRPLQAVIPYSLHLQYPLSLLSQKPVFSVDNPFITLITKAP
ncbi:hypothetical protein GDO81_013281 [Engystomops pustulosus]|uniref:Uncharacterized protein n=1 Tax=Engystomops pustulosus TaxID=76066 RepID=A0AAV7AY89_ENGPU|nr:hypothetical protein GDO81_013281 [Engystomops pustulosus]